MLTPQQKRWLSPVFPSTDGNEKDQEKGKQKEMDNKSDGAVSALVEVRTREGTNGGSPVNETEIWRRLKQVGLDEETLQKKDKAALIAHITKLESELYDYQYNMGLILLERKEWTSRYEQLKISAEEAEGNYKHDQAAHFAALADAEKREESLRKALGIEKQCVADLEKALHELRAESAEIKFVSENKLAQAFELLAATEDKSLAAESKFHAGEALQAEANRKRADAERMLQEVEAREDEFRRQRQAFKSEFDAHEKESYFERQSLREWQKKLQEGQDRLLEGQGLLNQREEYILERSEATKQIEKELQDVKRKVEKEQSTLKEKEADMRVKLADLTIREEALVKRETVIDKKEQELLLLQEKLATREREEIQRLTDVHQAVFEAKILEFEAEVEQKCRAVDDELENKRNAADMRELEMKCKEEKLSKRGQQLEKKAEKLKEKEKELDAKLKALKEREKFFRIDEKEFENQQKKLEEEREEMNNLKQVLEKLKAALEEERHRIHKEQEKLELTENEKNDMKIIQTKLKQEIDNLRAKDQELSKKEDLLNVDKEKFEREWEILDEKTEQLKKELEQVDEEKRRVSQWLKDEEERFKQERRVLREQIKSDEEALCLKKEAFASSKRHEETELLAKIERERADIYRDIELRTSELEKSFEQRREELERHYQDRESAFLKEKQKEMQQIVAQKEMSDKELEQIQLERQKLDREWKEIATTREQIEREWSEMKKDIEELQIQKDKLKEQRESLHNERHELEAQLDQLNKLKADLKMTEDSLKLSEQQISQVNVNDCEVISAKQFDGCGSSQAAIRQNVSAIPCKTDDFCSEIYLGGTPGSASDTPSSLGWLQKCASRLFKQTPGHRIDPDIRKQETEIETIFVSERTMGLRVDPPLSGKKKIDFLAEKGKCSSERQDDSLPVSKVTKTQPSSSGFNRHKTKNKGSLRVFKRTRSMRAVVDEAKGIFEVPFEENNKSENVKEPDGNDATNSEKAFEDDPECAQGNDEERGELLDNSRNNLYLGRKRHREHFSQGTIDNSVEDPEIRADIGGGEQRKRQREIANCSLVVESSHGKRYNFRDSTIANTMATCTSSAECKETDDTHEEDPCVNYSLEILKENEEKSNLLSHGKGNPKVSHKEMIKEYGRELLEDHSHVLTRVPSFNQIDKDPQESYSRGFEMSETELFAESNRAKDDKECDLQDFVTAEQDDEDEEPKSLKEKLWDFLTT